MKLQFAICILRCTPCRSCSLGLPYVLSASCLYVVLVISHYCFEDRFLVLVVPVADPDCLEILVALCPASDEGRHSLPTSQNVERKGIVASSRFCHGNFLNLLQSNSKKTYFRQKKTL